MILELIERLAREAGKHDLDFLIIGGHAVAHHGYARMTLDVDFLVRSAQREDWQRLLEKFHYVPHTESNAFMQCSNTTLGWPAVDLMFVHEETWKKLRAASVPKPHRNIEVRVPCVPHLIALKLHAATSPTRSSPAKDWNDIEELVRRHRLNPDDGDFSALVIRYGGEDALARLRGVWKNLPDSP